jgi:hypothetical protein
VDHNFIIKLLKEKEANLLHELQHVRDALNAFFKEHGMALSQQYNSAAELIPATYEACTTYNRKILFILQKQAAPMTVDEVTAEIMALQPDLNINKLHRTISYSLSMLAKTGMVKKHPFNRHIKYSLSI